MACGTGLRENAKFCDECGAAVAVSPEPAEYKQVTVLFADVVHSMYIAADVGPERLREIMTTLVDRAAHVVHRYGGTVDKFTGDGIMALFGAPMALEDHAIRACMAALSIQEEAQDLAAEVKRRNGVELQLRIGLNSGEVIAGQLGASSLGYTAVGEQVGLAQRMESVAPPGGVMLSRSTARLVEDTAVLDDREFVHVKGRDDPVPAHRLRGIREHGGQGGRPDVTLVGRRREIGALTTMLDRAIDGAGGVTGIVGPPGIGKSRLVRETTAMAGTRGVAVYPTYCQAHTCDIAFHAAADLLAALFDIGGLDADVARQRVRARLPDTETEDLQLLDDLLGISEPGLIPVDIDPDARRRRLTGLMQCVARTRVAPTLYVIEDAHWLDDASESLLADLLSVVPQTHSLALLTYRPEYHGVLARTPGSRTIAVAPLDAADISMLTTELLGTDSSVAGLAAQVAERSDGNPFFAEEIVRDLAERDVLTGEPGEYICRADSASVSVPATVQATIASRIDRLGGVAKRTLHAAAVLGSRFEADLLARVDADGALAELVAAELLELVTVSPRATYAFRHPLIRAVAYESQLKSDRSLIHERAAAAIETRSSSAGEENAALIATHLEAAGDLRAAFGWHMRAATWLTDRDIGAARASWQRARDVADRLPADDVERTSMRIAPRTLLCGYVWRGGGAGVADTGLDELRDLCDAAGDQMSLVMGTSGVLVAMTLNHRLHELRLLAPDYVRLLESTGDSSLVVGLLNTATHAMFEAGEVADALPLLQRVITLAEGDTSMGNFFFESPLAWAITLRGLAHCSLGRAGWRDDLYAGLAMAREARGMTQAAATFYGYAVAVMNGALIPDATTLGHTADVLASAERSGDDISLAWARIAHGSMLVGLHGGDHSGWDLLEKGRHQASLNNDLLSVTIADIQIAKCKVHTGDIGAAIEIAGATVEDLFAIGEAMFRGPATMVLAESLLRRGSEQDLQAAQTAIERLAASPTDPGFVLYELQLLRLRALLARSREEQQRYGELANQYRTMATSLGSDGHIAVAESMT